MSQTTEKPASCPREPGVSARPTLGRRLLVGLLILLFVALFTFAITVYIAFRPGTRLATFRPGEATI